MDSRQLTVGGCAVRVAGHPAGHAVILLAGEDSAGPVDAVCARLHESGLTTAVVAADPARDAKTARAVLEQLNLATASLFGAGTGAEPAWRAAAADPGRFTSLVVVDHGHPAAPDQLGAVRAPECPAVEIPTTAVAGSDTSRRRWLDDSSRYVFGDYRVVRLDAPDPLADSRAVTTEIVLRTSRW
jgi:pimeloyl-ACP methyl ester carboxylesterase